MDVKIGMKKNGKMTAASAVFRMQGGAFPGMAPTGMALECAFANYQLPAVHHIGYDVLSTDQSQQHTERQDLLWQLSQ